jgi:hypothetical protein
MVWELRLSFQQFIDAKVGSWNFERFTCRVKHEGEGIIEIRACEVKAKH